MGDDTHNDWFEVPNSQPDSRYAEEMRRLTRARDVTPDVTSPYANSFLGLCTEHQHYAGTQMDGHSCLNDSGQGEIGREYYKAQFSRLRCRGDPACAFNYTVFNEQHMERQGASVPGLVERDNFPLPHMEPSTHQRLAFTEGELLAHR